MSRVPLASGTCLQVMVVEQGGIGDEEEAMGQLPDRCTQGDRFAKRVGRRRRGGGGGGGVNPKEEEAREEGEGVGSDPHTSGV